MSISKSVVSDTYPTEHRPRLSHVARVCGAKWLWPAGFPPSRCGARCLVLSGPLLVLSRGPLRTGRRAPHLRSSLGRGVRVPIGRVSRGVAACEPGTDSPFRVSFAFVTPTTSGLCPLAFFPLLATNQTEYRHATAEARCGVDVSCVSVFEGVPSWRRNCTSVTCRMARPTVI